MRALKRVLLAVGVLVGALVGSSFGCAGPGYTAGLRKPLEVGPETRHAEARFTGARGLSLFEQAWLPQQGEPRAALIVHHGLKDHGSRYAELAQQLAASGYAVHAYDMRGHGDSEGERVWVEDFGDYVEDLATYVGKVRAQHPGKPVFLLGHSMGGAISTLLVAEKKAKVDGLILSAAALKPGKEVNGFLIWVTGVLGTATPRAKVLALEEKYFSRDPKVLEAMKSDPLVHQGAGPARTAKELLGALARIGTSMDKVDVPLLVLHGSDDRITPPEGSKELSERAAHADKTLKLYPGLYHDLLHEPEKDQVIADIRGWLDARVPAAPAPQPAAAVAEDVP